MAIKALLFDIGGVCVVSPFQAILDYEDENKISRGWINYAISRAAPDGAWQRMERGELGLDDAFHDEFKHDLQNPRIWMDFQRSYELRNGEGPSFSGSYGTKKRLEHLARQDPRLLNEGVTLPVESSSTSPAAQHSEVPAKSRDQSLKDVALRNPTQLGDPVRLEAEALAPDRENEAASTNAGTKRFKAQDIQQQGNLCKSKTANCSQLYDSVAFPPPIDTRALLDAIINIAQIPDPHMFPYLCHLTQHPFRPLLGALSNTLPSNTASNSNSRNNSTTTTTQTPQILTTLQPLFDIFIASTDVKLRKPDARIFQLALHQLDAAHRARTNVHHGGGSNNNHHNNDNNNSSSNTAGVKAEEVLFLDDIGENCRAARALGMRTLKVRLGRTAEAVRELALVTGIHAPVEGMKMEGRRSRL